MEDIPPAKAFLQTLWSEVRWKAKRDPSSDNFDELDMFVERHTAFFDAKILEAFSYETLFEQHFPTRYEKIKSLGIVESDWREKFLQACKNAYKTEAEIKKENRIYDPFEASDSDENNISGDFAYIPKVDSNKLISLNDPRLLAKERELEKNKIALWIAIKNRDLATLQAMIKAGKVSRKDLDNEDEVENVSLRQFAIRSGFQQALDETFENVVAPPLRNHEKTELRVIQEPSASRVRDEEDYSRVDFSMLFGRLADQQADAKLCDEDLLCEALRNHQSLDVIRQCCEKINVKEKMLSTYHRSWLQFACEYAHLGAAQFFVENYQLPVTQRVLEAVCIVGNLAVLKDFLPHASGEKIDIHRLCDWACQEGHLPLVKYFIEEMKIVAGPDEANFQKFVLSASARGHASVVKYLLEKYPTTERVFDLHTFDNAFKNGHVEVVEYVLNFMEEHFPRKTDEEKMEWTYWLVEQLTHVAEGYRQKGDDFNPAIFKCLLDKGTDLMALLQDAEGTQLLEKLAATFYAKSPIPPFLKLMLTTTIEEAKESDPVTSKMHAILLNALENPTPENYAALDSEECKAYFSSEPVVEGFGQLFTPFLKARNPNFSVTKVPKEVGHDSKAEIYFNTFSGRKNLVPVTVQNIDAVTLENTVMWEWIELVRRAVRYPSADNEKYVEDYLEKYKNLMGKEAIEFYEENKLHFVSPLARLPKVLLSHMFFKASNPSVALVNRAFRDAAKTMPASEFAYSYPREHTRILRENPEGKINWKEKLREADERAYENLPKEHKKLFRALRDPGKNVDAIQVVLQNIVFIEDYHPDRFLLRRDEVESENICQCARRNNFQPILDIIYAKMCETYRADQYQRQTLLRVAVACFQRRSELESYLGQLNKEEPIFEITCVNALKYAIQVENVDAAELLFQHAKLDVNQVLDVIRDERGTPLVYACEFNSAVMAWWLISRGADVNSLTPEERDKLVALTVERDEKFQQKVIDIFKSLVRSKMQTFFVPRVEEELPELEVDSEMTQDEVMNRKFAHAKKTDYYEAKKKRHEHNRPLYAAAQALLKVLNEPQGDEYHEELKQHENQLEGEELKSLYELCKPFLRTAQLLSDEVPDVPPSPRK